MSNTLIHLNNTRIFESFDEEETIGEKNLIEEEIKTNEIKEVDEKNLFIQDEDNQSIKYNDNDFYFIYERITNYIKKEFGQYRGNNLVNNHNDKILLKIFFINLVCKDLIYEYCEKYHNPKNNYDFFFNLAKQFNESITGLNNLKIPFEKYENPKKK